MGQLGEYLLKKLRLEGRTVHEDVRTPVGFIDFVIDDGADAYLVKIHSETAGMDALGQLHLFTQHPDMLGLLQPMGKVRGVLAAPSFSRNVEALAAKMEVATIVIPMRLLAARATNLLPITKPKAWNVVAAVVAQGHNPGVRRLAHETETSLGWTSGVVRGLQARGILSEDGEMPKSGLLRLLDQVASERPFEKLRVGSVDTGIHDWEDAIGHLHQQWEDIQEHLNPPGFHLCGRTAAMEYDDHMLHHSSIQVYANDSNTLEVAMQGIHDGGGVRFTIYKPDRPLAPGSKGDGPRKCISLRQAFLDVAGMGYAARDTALRLAEVLQREHQES